MSFNYYPDEITSAICEKIGETNPAKKSDIENAVYNLKAICENEYNSDFYRVFYKALEKLTEVLNNEN